MESMTELDQILERLERHRQPATYGAVAGVVGGIARGLMGGRPRVPRNSWIVSKGTRRPTGYATQEMHPELITALEQRELICSPATLQAWLAKHP